ncbi:facilitated trehalose transporter Tret1-like [Periplaneta americana]|uniref:facilitated trehalose transporter Tret1-like n=1 Tax=Periplaneta americana TaxID=6978 RepID=UPI0037E8EC05
MEHVDRETETESMAAEQETKTKLRRLLLPQLIVTCVCGAVAMTCGMNIGHSAVLIPRLQQNDSTIPIDDEIGSWIASVFSIGSPVGNIIGGCLADKLGRRKILRFALILYILGWSLLATAQSYQLIIATRLISGIARGMSADTLLVLLDEHSDAHLRGINYMHVTASYVVGMLIISGIGTVLNWRAATGVAIIFLITVFIATWALPESPIWLVRNGKTHEASRILEKAWGKHQKDQARQELGIMVSRCHKENTMLLSTLLQPHVIKSFVIAFLLIILQICSGVHVFITYSVDVVSRARHGSQDLLDEYAVTNIAGFLRFAVIIMMAWFSLEFKRRTIVLSSAIASGICLLILGTVITVNSTNNLMSERSMSWIVILLIFLYITISTGGVFAFPVAFVGELVPSKIRGMASGVIFAVTEVILGGVLKCSPFMWSTMGIHGMFWLFGFFCFLFALYVFLFVPETHNRTLVEVEEYFQGHNILWQNRPKKFRKEKSVQESIIRQNIPNVLEGNNTVYVKLRETEHSETQCSNNGL